MNGRCERRGRRLCLRPAGGCAGFTLVEVMTACAIGLVVLAGATVAFADMVRSAGRQLLAARVDQDLRIALDLMAGELRRAGHWQEAQRALRASATSPALSPHNPYQPIELTGGALLYRQSRDAENDTVDTNEAFGFRLRAGAVEFKLGGSGWQSVTDVSVVTVTQLSFVPVHSALALDSACASVCGPGASPSSTGALCPTLTLRRYELALKARATADATVVRNLLASVRVRNDALEGGCA
ncbi:MAG: hypothetical protein JWP52_4517 [Rhizobacter sp.]|nr:hypothetical protein [Rhizobacter sp.]